MGVQLIEKYFPNLSSEQQNAINQLGDLYTDWNAKINVISRKDMENFYEHHVLHALAIAKVIDFKPGTTLLDVGTGGGFPGIPLAILFPECQFHLIDAINKKITVVKEVYSALGLKNVTGEQKRVEALKRKYDFVLSRAVTRFDKFFEICNKNILFENKNELSNGILYLKGGDFKDELNGINKKITLYNISDYFSEPFFETKKVIHVAVAQKK
jgi:16S rRNA (guanine527-N7)-methyltransferase